MNRRRICIITTFIIFAVSTILIIWLGFYDPKKFNGESAKEAQCIITGHYIVPSTCFAGSLPPIQFDCNNCDIELTHYINDTLYNANVTVNYYTTLRCDFNKYSMGNQVGCWYNVNDPYDIHLGELSKTMYVFSTIVTLLLFIVVFTVIMVVNEAD